MRAALDGALIRADIISGAELVIAIGQRWRILGHEREARARIELFAAQLPEADPLVRAQLLGLHALSLVEGGSAAFGRPGALTVRAIASDTDRDNVNA